MGRSPLIVIDSIEALSEKYDISSQLLFSVLYADIVERSEGNLIFILEATENPKLEYFADGVISMDYSVIDDFLVRIASIEKLRGISIGSSPKFLYTLSDGRCRAFTKNMIIYPEKKIEVTRGDVTEQFYVPILSSDFHKLTKSGESEVSLGSVIMLHRQGNSDDVDAVVNLFKNNLMGRGVIDATSSSYETSNVLSNCLDADAMKHYITAEKSKRSNSYVINLEGKSILEDFPNDVIDFFMSSSARPHLYFFSTDFMLFTYGENFFGDLINLLNSIRPTGAVFIITDDNIFNKISHYASLILHFREVNGYTFVNSNKNRSFVAGTRYSRDGWPDITLSEIV
ncbi:ATPase [Thermoplasmatales archaeon AK]|nr:ATPase [Thermoplasmatales archaeon AK]